jgi:hypothetical protein
MVDCCVAGCRSRAYEGKSVNAIMVGDWWGGDDYLTKSNQGVELFFTLTLVASQL